MIAQGGDIDSGALGRLKYRGIFLNLYFFTIDCQLDFVSHRRKKSYP
jgi:hypothetical protein